MHDHRVRDGALSPQECLDNAHTELLLTIGWEVIDDLYKWLQRQNVRDIFYFLEDLGEEQLEGLHHVGLEVPHIVGQLVEPLQNEGVKSILFVSGQILEDNCRERAQQF